MNIMETDNKDMARMVVGHANNLRIHSGNIINWFSLKKGVGKKSSEELIDSVESTINAWTNSIGLDIMSIEEPLGMVDITNRSLVKKFEKDDHDKLKFSVKIFLTQWKPELIRQAIDQVCQSLDVTSIDSVIVSFPMTPLTDVTNNNNSTMPEFNKVKPIWKELEHLVDTGKISHIGVTDFDKQGLEELHQWSRIKPSIDQIGMTNCCTVPADLIEFSKEFDIELLSHNDAPEILTARSFQNLLQDTIQDMNANEWTPSFVARYSVILRCRGIVEAKGYVVGAERKVSSNGVEDYGFF
ncbi:glutamate--cysteine ligase regulatory subunit-like [Styela clava]|uniref:glutamate--cysteine ligase regulatory subunit-like n=1 Tax=Styela clava TaxID=7725 RepID=UPI0019396A2F|nr:glutamate--cysteine ligase regulatory subunit-like [Styela clava]